MANPTRVARAGAGYVTRNWRDAALPTAVASGGAAASAATDRRNHRSTSAVGAAGGAVAAEGAWRATGLGIRAQGRKAERTLPEGMTRSQRTKIMRDHRKKYDIEQGDKAGVRANPDFMRQYPKELPGYKYKRVLGHMSGRRGLAMEAGLVAGGAYGGSKLVGHNRNAVGKRLTFEEDKVNPARAAVVGTGAAGVAYGLPRMKWVGIGLRAGAREHPDAKTRDLLRRAEGMRRAWLTGTQPVDRLGRMPGISAIGRALPKKARPAAAVVGGLATIRVGLPVEEKRYAPVTGW